MEGVTQIEAPTNTSPKQITDEDIWVKVLKLQLNGVMTHIALFEQMLLNGVCGCAALHKYYAMEEFKNFLHVSGDYIYLYNKIAETPNVSQPIIKIDGATLEEKMIKCMEAHRNWEKEVCEHLKKYQTELKDGKEHINYLLDDVRKEMKCINLMMNDLYDGKCEELNKWLETKYGEE